MIINSMTPWIVLLSIWLGTNLAYCQPSTFLVTDYGAISDGETDNKQSFLDAWTKACQSDGGSLVIPSGSGTYLLSAAQFSGPCNGETKVLINGTLKASSDPSLTTDDYWITFYSVTGLTIYGSGTLDGNGAAAWGKTCPTCNKPPPTSLKLSSVTNGVVQGITSLNSKFFHMSIIDCQNMTLNQLRIAAPGNSPNTDGIHIGRSNDVRISDANIGTGDDCISLGDGSTNVNITGVSCGPGHGISIGSLGRYPAEKDVGYVIVSNCSLSNTDNGLRIKTWAPSPPSSVYTVTYQGITMSNVRNPIIIDQHYCPEANCREEGESSVGIKDVKFIDVHGSSAMATGVSIVCSKLKPCQGIQFSGLNLTFNGQSTTASCANVAGEFLGSYQAPPHC